MKKINTIIISLCISLFINSAFPQNQLKGNGEVFYHQTFDWEDPDYYLGWKAEEGFIFLDPLDKGYNWHWYPNDSLISKYVKEPPFRSSSAEDGHLCLFLSRYTQDLPNGADTAFGMVNNGIEFPTFDCSDHSSVIVSYETNFMIWPNGGMEMFVSNNGIHWAKWELGFKCGQRERPKDIEPGGVALFETSISDVAAGEPNVQIRIYWQNAMQYYWLIDDFKLSEAYNYDMRGLDCTLEWDDSEIYTKESFIYNLPISQLGGSFTNFEMGYVNFGEFPLKETYFDVDISKNHQSIAHYSTYPNEIAPSQMESFLIEDNFTPTELGHYKISYEIKHEQEDHTPDDNKYDIYFNVSDSIYSRCDDTPESSYSHGYYDTGYDGETNEQIFIGTAFPIYGDTKIKGMSAYITGGLADGEILLRGALYKLKPREEDEWGGYPWPWLFSEIVELDSSMFNTWVYFPFEHDGESEYFTAGEKYYVGIEYWNYHKENDPYKKYLNLEIGLDRGIKLKDPIFRYNAVTMYTGAFSASYGDQKNLMIRMILDDHSNRIDSSPLAKVVSRLEQNYPNPADQQTLITYEIISPSDVELKITDIAGRIVQNIYEGSQTIGEHTIRLETKDLKPGVYFYNINAGNYVETKKMIVK